MRYVSLLILCTALAACGNGEAAFGQPGQQTVVVPFRITFPAEGGIAGTRPQIRWNAAPGVSTYEVSVWRDASLTDLADFQRTTETSIVVRTALPSGSTAFAEVRARSGFQNITTGIVSFTISGAPHTAGSGEGNRLASLASEGGAAIALLDMAGNATWFHAHEGPGTIVDARVLPHGVAYTTETSAHEVGWDGMAMWEGPAGAFADGPGQTALYDHGGNELRAWPSPGAGEPAEAGPVDIGGQVYNVLWAVTTNG